MDNITNNGIRSASNDELNILCEQMKRSDIVQEKIRTLSEDSFAEWFQAAFQAVALSFGFAMAEVMEFLVNMGYAFAYGFKQGFKAAVNNGRTSREKIRKRFGGE